MFVVIGLNQQTPLAYREQIAIQSANLSASICQLHQLPGISACTVLSTCNRTEIYAETTDPKILLTWFKNHHTHLWEHLEPYLYVHIEIDALVHALHVACGLDSMLLGEPQVLGQLKQAFHLAIELGTINDALRNWFEFIFQMTKKIRTQSGISEHPISVASVAVDCIQQHIPELASQKALIIGSGDTARLAAIHLQEKGCHQFLITSRHMENALSLSALLAGTAIPITELNHYLHQVDIIITATSCPFPFISRNAIETALHQRQHQPMVLVDLAVPRDIEPEVTELAHITLINIDHLQQIQAHHQTERMRAGQVAKQMILEAIDVYDKKQKSLQAQSLISDYRSHMKTLAQTEIDRAHQKLSAGHCQFQVINELSERLIQKIIHHPTVGMQKAASDNRQDLLELAHYLFNPHRNDTVTS